MRVKVSDFGFSEVFKAGEGAGHEADTRGTALYAAPEVWRKEGCTTASDVYSFGIILWEILTEEEPFQQYMYMDATSFYNDVIVKGVRPAIPQFSPLVSAPHVDSMSFLVSSQKAAADKSMVPTPETLVALISACWDPEPAKRPDMQAVHIDLENALLECQIVNPAAREFWRKNFRGGEKGSLLEEVSWYDFSMALARGAGFPLCRVGRLQSIVASGDVVTRKLFNSAVKWFGEFFVEAGETIADEMVALADSDWFCGDITKDLADRWLTDRENLTFLVRSSLTDPEHFPFTISKRKNGRNLHRRVERITYDPQAAERYRVEVGGELGFITAATLGSLVEKLQEIGNIGKPCPKEELVTTNPYEATTRY